jgi:hypothetical protein
MEKRKIGLSIVIVFVLFMAGVSSADPLQGASPGTADQPLGAIDLTAGIPRVYAAGDVIQSWPASAQGNPWGIAYDSVRKTVWVGDGWGDHQFYEYRLNGTPTGTVHPSTWSPASGPADLTYNWNTGMLWVMDVATDNCIHEINPETGVTGSTICPAFGTNQRGLAYDPETNTWFAGSWNDLTIHHFNSSGGMLDQVNVGLGISGLAYNPMTKHLFVMTNDDPNLLYVLDAANSYALVRQLSLPELGPYEGAGLEIDSNGKLWLVNQGTDTVYQIESGETTNLGAWSLWNPAPFDSMDTVVIAYKGRIYYVGGYQSGGKVGIYNPSIDFWTVGAPEPSPNIQYPVDGCLGLNSSGQPVIVLFPDTTGSVSGILHRYNIATNSWDTPPVPSGFPANGQWAHKIVSMLTATGENVCYISGGASTPGGGNLNTLWAYHPAGNTITDLGDFTHHPAGFDFHASWYVPWIGSEGGICVAGGIDSGSNVISDTQCYDLGTASFLLPNSDLPRMPNGIWAAADVSMMGREGSDLQLWVANGIHASLGTWKGSIYYSSLDGQWHDGPSLLYGAYRLGGATDTRQGTMHVIGGGLGGFFSPSPYNQVLAPIYTRLLTLLRPNGGEVPSGLPYTVHWAAPLKASKYSLMYSKDSGTTWILIDNDIAGRRYDWNVPIATKGTKTWRLRITAYDAAGKKVGTDNSNSNFKVAIASITSPNGGEILTVGDPDYNITWQTNPSVKVINKVILSYTLNGGTTWKPIQTYVGTNPGSHSWTFPPVTSAKTKCKVKVVFQDSTGKTIDSDMSDGNFTITPLLPSDRNLKENISPIKEREILALLAAIPVSKWNYKNQDPSIHHIGPMAQDFHAAFGVGESDRFINMVDANGVALAAIKGLYDLLKEKEEEMNRLKRENSELREEIRDIGRRLSLVETPTVK